MMLQHRPRPRTSQELTSRPLKGTNFIQFFIKTPASPYLLPWYLLLANHSHKPPVTMKAAVAGTMLHLEHFLA
jgi:hypothetical protein